MVCRNKKADVSLNNFLIYKWLCKLPTTDVSQARRLRSRLRRVHPSSGVAGETPALQARAAGATLSQVLWVAGETPALRASAAGATAGVRAD